MTKVGIVGGTGYTGVELLRLLAHHQGAHVEVLTSRQESGKRADQLFPQLRGYCDAVFESPDIERLAKCDAVFFATPHGTCMQMAPQLIERGVRIIDLSADFRLKDRDVFQRWYKMPHTAFDLLQEAVYGLPEFDRFSIAHARLVASPGCYPTAVQLALMPLLELGALETTGIIADCKSGVTGAGREAKIGSLYCEATDSLKAYGVAGHRHLPEIEQQLAVFAGESVQLTFVPHLTPMSRGIHATIYVRPKDPDMDFQSKYELRYRGEPFVDVMPAGEHPETRSVRGSNVCRIALHRAPDRKTLVILAAIDNLVKGASGQALQCFNLMFGFPETQGLDGPALAP
ncbi:N-acetyl-gamma-glutamyl-phosphate reductase [Panacagrimonas perspica]|uniref:N-acetyl-gamma-glutamyl-phosphate reductase n=1 Tax=Panacagrimonas perspica TaxID=381431 RepID=A0A4S3K902_9GAMM|nr:N-acetyl-gamma-glutamyl-phosphate reductase [Panacagrimonas perspica]TDU24376.1 N-acetyl-gamma-glutamyl-phosphate reductase [Panacagrimonas perspica]THD04763.1 N-acetyl-gamma-glutamyl-phosphate reductase [Panacagrimonas perspica]